MPVFWSRDAGFGPEAIALPTHGWAPRAAHGPVVSRAGFKCSCCQPRRHRIQVTFLCEAGCVSARSYVRQLTDSAEAHAETAAARPHPERLREIGGTPHGLPPGSRCVLALRAPSDQRGAPTAWSHTRRSESVYRDPICPRRVNASPRASPARTASPEPSL